MPRVSLVRPITPREVQVIERVLEVGAERGAEIIDREALPKLSVIRRCDCGCDTVDFQGCDWANSPRKVAEAKGRTEAGREVVVMIFADGSDVKCLEVYNHSEEPARLPDPGSIQPW